MKPKIGLLSKICCNEAVGLLTNLGAKFQDWMLLAEDYIEIVESQGGVPIIIPIIDDCESMFNFVKELDGIIFTGGNDIDPKYYGEQKELEYKCLIEKLDKFEMELYKSVYEKTQMPILGICRGMQLMNVAHGGTLYQEMRTGAYEKHFYYKEDVAKTLIAHKVNIEVGSRLMGIFGERTIETNSFHHQSVKKAGKNLKIVAMSEDGVVEAVESDEDRFVVGVQWHPEMLGTKTGIDDLYSKKLVKSFIDATKKRRI